MERRKICRYFERGACKKDNCPFVHLKENRKACQFYLEGTCKKGTNCNFYHPPKEEEKLANLKEELKNKNKQQKIQQYYDEDEEEEVRDQVKIQQQEKPLEEEIQQKLQINQQSDQEKQEQEDHFKEPKNIQEKMEKIDFLLGINNNDESSSDSEGQIQQKPKVQEKEILQFFKIYNKKFADQSKTPEIKAFVAKNQQKYFKQFKFLVLISKLQDPFEKQYYQIIRKFQDSYTQINQNEIKHYLIKIRPLIYDKEINLHFQFKEETINLEVDAIKYPQEKAKFIITNESIPEEYKQKFIQILNKIHEKKNLFETLKYIQNNFQKIYGESKFKLQNQYFSKKQREKKLKEQQKEQKIKVLQGNNPIQQQIRMKKAKVHKSRNENKDYIEVRYKEGQKVQNLFFGYELTIESILLHNCEYIVIENLLLYIECVCEKKFMYVFNAREQKNLKLGVKLICKKCSIVISIGVEREVVQPKHQNLGRIGVDNGLLLDIGGFGCKIGCKCNNEIGFGKILLSGEKININCHSCFQSMNFAYSGLKFYNPNIKSFQMQSDHELPNKGVCRHMKLSFRWFRYGCCGRCFSCDDCHIMESVSLHQKVKGITMICGYCSREQLTSSQCIYCKKQLVKGVNKGGHWEGGMGCRDQTLLSKKDGKKYSGLTKKKP